MAKPNRGINFGTSSRLGYDACFIKDDIEKSTGPLAYKLNPNQIKNCQACLPVFGPQIGYMGYGDSTTVGNTTAPSQDLVDIESILTNRNVIASKCKDGGVNDINVLKFKLKHARICDDALYPIASHLTNPPATYREMAINRFIDLPTNPQMNVFWNESINTQLEAKDNYCEKIPKLRNNDPTLPPNRYKNYNKYQCQ